MPTRSQRHLRHIQGVDSGDRAPAYTPAKTAGTVTIAGAGTATVTFTVAGGNAEGLLAGTLAITGLAVGAAAVPVPVIAITSGMTRNQLAARIAATINGRRDAGLTVTMVATATGAVATVTVSGGGTIAGGLARTITNAPAAEPLFAPWPVKTIATATVAGTTTATATITIGGGNAEGLLAGTLTIAGLAVGAAAVPVPVIAITSGMSRAQLAARVAFIVNGREDAGETITMVATASGAVVTITKAGGGTIAAGLTATVA